MAGTGAEIKVSLCCAVPSIYSQSLLEFNEHIKGAASANLKNVCIFSRLGQTLVQLCRLYFEKGA